MLKNDYNDLGNHGGLFAAFKLDAKQFPGQNSGLARHSRLSESVISPLAKLQAGIFLTKAGLAAIGLIMLAGDINSNPGPFDWEIRNGGKGLTIGHWNIQQPSDPKFEQLLASLNTTDITNKVDTFILTETFCNDKRSDSFYQIQGYDLFRKDRVRKKGGDRPLSAKAQDKNIGKNIENVHLLNRETILLGDFNINYLNKSALNKHRLVKTLGNLHFTQVVKDITRPISGKCLDHIWANYPERLINVGIRDIALSDHLLVITMRLFKGQGTKQKKHNHVFVYRDLKRLDKERFVEELNEAPWDTAFNLMTLMIP